MPYIIDGHNLIPKVRGLDLKDIDDEYQLIEMLQEFCLKQGKQVEVFFDNASIGTRPVKKMGRVTARFIHSSSTADQAIRRRLMEIGPGARNYWVVSSDGDVQRSAREFHARPISSEDFTKFIFRDDQNTAGEPEKDPDTSLSSNEVDNWLDIFKKRPKK
jgi:uncharacterized protein